MGLDGGYRRWRKRKTVSMNRLQTIYEQNIGAVRNSRARTQSAITPASAKTPASHRIISRFNGIHHLLTLGLAGISLAANHYAAAIVPPLVVGWGGRMIGLLTATLPPLVVGWGGRMTGLLTATLPPLVVGWGGRMIGLLTATLPPLVVGWGGRMIGLLMATLPPLVVGWGGRMIGLLSANAMAEKVENTKSAAKRKVEKNVIGMVSL